MKNMWNNDENCNSGHKMVVAEKGGTMFKQAVSKRHKAQRSIASWVQQWLRKDKVGTMFKQDYSKKEVEV